jgi:uncharacterized protein (TIGR02453 family)
VNVSRLLKFLVELSYSNNKPWFDAHRSEYQAVKSEFVSFVAETVAGISQFDSSVKGINAKDCLFRINRDTRFSNDKNPYKTQFSAAINPAGRHSAMPLYYFHISGTESSTVAGGIYMPQPTELQQIRQHIVQHPKKAAALLKEKPMLETFGGLGGEVLKRLPKGYDADAPHPELLKRKSFILGQDFDAYNLESQDLKALLLERFHDMQPLMRWLRDAFSYSERNSNG